jgi:murein DD-endopeptidase MepM/ murein hydrolase activator NlpD
MQGLTTDRRHERSARRKQIRRRRFGALVLVVTLVFLAVWAAIALPTATPAKVPEMAVRMTFGATPATDQVVIARVNEVPVLLPVPGDATTAVAYHPVGSPDAVAFSPEGECVSGGGIARRLADIFKSGGGLQYYLIDGNGGEASPQTAGLSVGAVPGSSIVSPVDGVVVAVKEYKLLGRHADVQVDIRLAADPTLMLVLTHVEDVQVEPGEQVVAGETPIGAVRAFDRELDQALRRFTSDNGDHAQLMVLRVTSELGEF